VTAALDRELRCSCSTCMMIALVTDAEPSMVELAIEIRHTMDAADTAAADAVSESMLVDLYGRDPRARDASFRRAKQHVVRARVQLELLAAKREHAGITEIARALSKPVDYPDEDWRLQIASARSQLLAVLAELDLPRSS